MSLAYLKVDDVASAQTNLTKAQVRPDSYRFVADYLLITTPEDVASRQGVRGLDAAQALIEGSTTESLATTQRYRAALDTLVDEHLALAWFDLPGIVEVTKFFDVDPELTELVDPTGSFAAMKKQIDDTGAITMQAYVEPTSVKLRMTTERIAPNTNAGSSTLLDKVPANSVAALSVSDFDANAPGGVTQGLDSIARSTREFEGVDGASVGDESADDLAALVEVTRSLRGGAVATMGMADVTDVADIPFGSVLTTSNPAQTTASLDGLMAALGNNEDLSVSRETIAGGSFYEILPVEQSAFPGSDGNGLDDLDPVPSGRVAWYVGVVENQMFVGNDTEYLAAMISGDSTGLGRSPKFAEAVGVLAPDTGVGAFYVDIEGVYEMVKGYQANVGETSAPSNVDSWISAMKVAGVNTSNVTTNGTGHSRVDITLVFK